MYMCVCLCVGVCACVHTSLRACVVGVWYFTFTYYRPGLSTSDDDADDHDNDVGKVISTIISCPEPVVEFLVCYVF